MKYFQRKQYHIDCSELWFAIQIYRIYKVVLASSFDEVSLKLLYDRMYIGMHKEYLCDCLISFKYVN